MTADARPDSTRPPRRGLSLLRPDHHRRIQDQCRELLACAYADDPRALASRWADFEVELRAHIAAEEEAILPGYSKFAPQDAQEILDDHARLRELLTPVGVEIELHLGRLDRLRLLADELDAHELREDAGMYPWACANLTAD